ncbi:hypothetical protein HD553DRAFT_320999 [Filobasidium floriforme]|uniref:uncharacterized protein n=1 Tax=Filobasidium floriforme TaxID=5210 RepID=UPI001E8D95E9|nr:uncharacterized protein HD553DRAFT_320999 [Filobasidium floriforme]KAH8090262.1 hypothetical protein HD553DRAFT_320999 [Filobasidium floriforme]
MSLSVNIVSTSLMISPTEDQTGSSLTTTDGRTQHSPPPSSSQPSKKPSWLSRFSRSTNKERKNTGLAINLIDVPYVSIRTTTSSTLPTPRYPSEPILTSTKSKFLKAFEDAIRQCPDWRKRFLMKANEPNDQERAPAPLIERDCRNLGEATSYKAGIEESRSTFRMRSTGNLRGSPRSRKRLPGMERGACPAILYCTMSDSSNFLFLAVKKKDVYQPLTLSDRIDPSRPSIGAAGPRRKDQERMTGCARKGGVRRRDKSDTSIQDSLTSSGGPFNRVVSSPVRFYKALMFSLDTKTASLSQARISTESSQKFMDVFQRIINRNDKWFQMILSEKCEVDPRRLHDLPLVIPKFYHLVLRERANRWRGSLQRENRSGADFCVAEEDVSLLAESLLERSAYMLWP